MKIRCRILIDSDVDYKNRKQFADLVMIYLNDPNGWSQYDYEFVEVDSNEDVMIHLSTPKTIGKECGDSTLSCAEVGGKQMYLNSKRWFEGAPKSKLQLEDYRQYVVSHEMGHILGHTHKKCKCKGCLAPIMMQQTKGIGMCLKNTAVQLGV